MDGDYELSLMGKTVIVFCYKMGGNVVEAGAPFAYITLQSSSN
jgi:hypothetical protein